MVAGEWVRAERRGGEERMSARSCFLLLLRRGVNDHTFLLVK